MGELEDSPWSEGIDFITKYLVKHIVDDEKVVTISSNSDRERVLETAHKALEFVVLKFADRRETILHGKVAKVQTLQDNTQNQLNILRTTKENLDEQIEEAKQELQGAEKSYSLQIDKLTKDHKTTLERCDADISSRDAQIDSLKEKVNNLKTEAIDKRGERYIRKLQTELAKITEDNKELQDQLKELDRIITSRDGDIQRERNNVSRSTSQVGEKIRLLGEERAVIRSLQLQVSILEAEKKRSQDTMKELNDAIEDKQKTVDGLKRDIEEITKKSARSKSEMSIKSNNSAKGAGNLGSELSDAAKKEMIEDLTNENSALQVQINQHETQLNVAQNRIETLEKDLQSSRDAEDKSDQRVRELEDQAKERVDKSLEEIDRLKAERDELEISLIRAQAKNDENSNEIERLRATESNRENLQKRERELQSQLKEAEDELKRLRRGSGGSQSTGGDATAAVAICEREKAELQRELENAKNRLEKLSRSFDDLAQTIPPKNNEMLRLGEKLMRAEDDLVAAQAESARIQYQLDEVTKTFNEHLSKIPSSSIDVFEYYRKLFEKLQRHTGQVQGNLVDQIKLNQTTKEQYVERLGQMNDEIKKNPRSAESNLIRKRVAGVEREIERMTGIIKALTEEEAWFQDTIERFREGGAKTEAAIAQATADAETARQRLAEVLAQQGGGQEPPAAPAQPAPEGIIGVVGAKNVVAMNLVVFLIMLAMTLATGREYSLMRWANQPVRRAYFVNTMDKVAISLRVPSYELLWEFVAVVALGLGFKWTP